MIAETYDSFHDFIKTKNSEMKTTVKSLLIKRPGCNEKGKKSVL